MLKALLLRRSDRPLIHLLMMRLLKLLLKHHSLTPRRLLLLLLPHIRRRGILRGSCLHLMPSKRLVVGLISLIRRRGHPPKLRHLLLGVCRHI